MELFCFRAFLEISFPLMSPLLGHPTTAGIKRRRHFGTDGVCTHRKGNYLRNVVSTFEKLCRKWRVGKT